MSAAMQSATYDNSYTGFNFRDRGSGYGRTLFYSYRSTVAAGHARCSRLCPVNDITLHHERRPGSDYTRRCSAFDHIIITILHDTSIHKIV